MDLAVVLKLPSYKFFGESMEQIIIKFAKHQKLPQGYRIEYWECDEHYHWVIDDDNYSEIYSSKWQAYKSAWAHYNASQKHL